MMMPTKSNRDKIQRMQGAWARIAARVQAAFTGWEEAVALLTSRPVGERELRVAIDEQVRRPLEAGDIRLAYDTLLHLAERYRETPMAMPPASWREAALAGQEIIALLDIAAGVLAP
jgi:hypothetical protein